MTIENIVYFLSCWIFGRGSVFCRINHLQQWGAFWEMTDYVSKPNCRVWAMWIVTKFTWYQTIYKKLPHLPRWWGSHVNGDRHRMIIPDFFLLKLSNKNLDDTASVAMGVVLIRSKGMVISRRGDVNWSS